MTFFWTHYTELNTLQGELRAMQFATIPPIEKFCPKIPQQGIKTPDIASSDLY